MNLTMLLMYRFPLSAVSGLMSMSARGSGLDPGISFVLAFVLVASAIFTLASPNKGASRHGTHVGLRMSGAGPGGATRHPGGADTPMMSGEPLLAAPRLEDASHAVMCVAMGFLLVLML